MTSKEDKAAEIIAAAMTDPTSDNVEAAARSIVGILLEDEGGCDDCGAYGEHYCPVNISDWRDQ